MRKQVNLLRAGNKVFCKISSSRGG